MITAGIDLAADSSRTAAVRIDWTRRTVTHALTPAGDDALLDLVADADRIGVDCPLGWPDPFVAFVTAHRDGMVDVPAATIADRRGLVYRATDLHCQRLGHRPLSVAADRIGHAALRGAALLARLGETDRSGAGRVVEAYPAGSLKVWGLIHRRYKDDPARITASLDGIAAVLGLSFVAGARETCVRSDHAFDAVVVAVTARAAALGLCDRPPPEHEAAARREGWIALPRSPLADVATGHSGVT